MLSLGKRAYPEYVRRSPFVGGFQGYKGDAVI